MKAWCFKLYCCAILFIITLPLFATAANLLFNVACNRLLINEPELNGVVNTPEKPILSIDTLKSGQFQSQFEDFFAHNLVTRKTQTRIYNQLLCSLFCTTGNSNIIVGKDGYLFETVYATAYFAELSSQQIIDLKENVAKLCKLAELLKEKGVLMVVRMSPSKVEHYPEYLPSAYSRFVHMKQEGEYGANWYKIFCEEIEKTNIPYYDRYDLIQEMKENGEIAFTKGGTHWSSAPMAEYINGLNALIEDCLNIKLGRMIVESYEVKIGEMGIPDDSDIWDICWNVFYNPPDYPSPHISYVSRASEVPLRVFTVGQSFTTMMLQALYSVQPPVWDEVLFSWYNTYVIQFPSDVPWGTKISEETTDYEEYLSKDIILVDFLESGDGASQFQFVNNMLDYLERNQ